MQREMKLTCLCFENVSNITTNSLFILLILILVFLWKHKIHYTTRNLFTELFLLNPHNKHNQ